MSHLLRPGETSMLKELKEAGYYVWMNDRNDLTAGRSPAGRKAMRPKFITAARKSRAPVM